MKPALSLKTRQNNESDAQVTCISSCLTGHISPGIGTIQSCELNNISGGSHCGLVVGVFDCGPSGTTPLDIPRPLITETEAAGAEPVRMYLVKLSQWQNRLQSGCLQ